MRVGRRYTCWHHGDNKTRSNSRMGECSIVDININASFKFEERVWRSARTLWMNTNISNKGGGGDVVGSCLAVDEHIPNVL